MTPEYARDQVYEAVRRRLIASMRDELRTPINHIIGYGEILQEEAQDQGQNGLLPDLQRIQGASLRLLTLVNDYLDEGTTGAGEVSTGRLSHELRGTLNAIVGYSEMMQEEIEDREGQDFVPDLQKISLAAKHMLALVNGSLAFSQIEALERVPERITSPTPEVGYQAIEAAGACGDREVAGLPAVRGKLLVVDDNEMNRDMLSRRLTREGHTVATAQNGGQALNMVRIDNFDLVLLDVMMADMDGYQVLQHLKSDHALRHIPVIMLSALEEIDSVVRCIEMGAEDYLPKPYNPVLLRARIGACLEKKKLRDQEVSYLKQIEDEKQRADQLLEVILPKEVVEELKTTDAVRPRRYENVAVLFCDIMEFTSYCDGRQPEEVIPGLQRLVGEYEDLALQHNLEKIKTIGDSFMAVCGLLRPDENPVLNCVRCSLEMIEAALRMPENWHVRVGINVGPVVAGVVGHRQYLFDLWGDTVNIAARMESSGMGDSVNLSRVAWEQISDRASAESLGMVEVKGKGELEIFRFTGFVAA